MKTLHGYEAIEAAQPYAATLYDTDLHQELSVDEVLQLLETAHRPVRSFALLFWPESNDEADAVVLRAYKKHLAENQQTQSTLQALFPAALTIGPIHPVAAELAAQRLDALGKLSYVRTEADQDIYRLRREVCLSDTLQANLLTVACEDCARLELTGPFHEVCLTNLIDFLQTHEFKMEDLTAATDPDDVPEASWLKAAGRTSESVQKFAKTALSTGRKWQERLRAATARPAAEGPDEPARPQATAPHSTSADTATREGTSEGPPGTPGVDSTRLSTTASDAHTQLVERPSVTQSDLIRYLQSIDIVSAESEAAVRREYTQALRRMSEKERELEDLRKQRNYVEQQFSELQRDMETVLEALQIARRRDTKSSNTSVIDANYE